MGIVCEWASVFLSIYFFLENTENATVYVVCTVSIHMQYLFAD